MAEYIVQKAVSLDKVKKKLQRPLTEYSIIYDAYRKYDGCCVVLYIGESHGHCMSRTGEIYPSMDEVLCAMHDELGGGFVIIGEAWWPGKDQFNLISGEFRRLQRSDRLQLAVHDVLTVAEFDAGHSPVPFRERMLRLPGVSGHRWFKAEGWAAGTYGNPQDLCNQLVDEGGYDGLILRDPWGTWTKGNGTTGEIIKIKRVLSFDLRVVDMMPGQGKHAGRMGAIVVDFGGKRLSVGTGFTDEQREVFWSSTLARPDHPIVGKIVEVEAMDYSSDGLLREPRFKGVRFDKLEADAA